MYWLKIKRWGWIPRWRGGKRVESGIGNSMDRVFWLEKAQLVLIPWFSMERTSFPCPSFTSLWATRCHKWLQSLLFKVLKGHFREILMVHVNPEWGSMVSLCTLWHIICNLLKYSYGLMCMSKSLSLEIKGSKMDFCQFCTLWYSLEPTRVPIDHHLKFFLI